MDRCFEVDEDHLQRMVPDVERIAKRDETPDQTTSYRHTGQQQTDA